MQPKLIIKKRLVQVSAEQIKPSVNAIARLPREMGSLMLDTFGLEILFQKSVMIGERPTDPDQVECGAFQNKVLDAFYRRDESMEITVRSLMLGQTYVGEGIWDALGYEYIAKRSFDTMLQLVETIREFDEELVYLGARHPTSKFKPGASGPARNELRDFGHEEDAIAHTATGRRGVIVS